MDQSLLIWVIDAIIVFTLIELVLIGWLKRRHAHGPRLAAMSLNIVSGLCLMLALRLALTQPSHGLVLMCLAASGLLHGIDLWRRWQR